mgnify:CR=1 FL=1
MQSSKLNNDTLVNLMQNLDYIPTKESKNVQKKWISSYKNIQKQSHKHRNVALIYLPLVSNHYWKEINLLSVLLLSSVQSSDSIVLASPVELSTRQSR